MRVQQIKQNAFIKTMTPVETKLLERLMEEEKQRLEFSYRLQAQQQKLAEAVANLEGVLASWTSLIQDLAAEINGLKQQLEELQPGGGGAVDTYTRSEIDSMLAAYYVEEIQAPYGSPENEIFDSIPSSQKLTGYEHFLGARLCKTQDVTLGPGRARRYTIGVYTMETKELVFPIIHRDCMTVYCNRELVARLSGDAPEGEINEVRVALKPGWNCLQFLVANKEYGASFDIGLDLAQEVDRVACLNPGSFLMAGSDILPGAINPGHIDSSGNYHMQSLQLGNTLEPALVCGSDDRGSVRIGGAELDYADQKLTIRSGIRVEGVLEYSELQAEGRPGASFLWSARDIYLPPASLIDDSLACRGEAALIPASAPRNVISCPGEEIICPGPYRLYIRLRPQNTAAGLLARLNIKSGGSLIKAVDINGSDFSQAQYRIVETTFEHGGGDLSFELLAGGASNICLDYIYIRLGN